MNRYFFDTVALSSVQSLVPEALSLKNGTVEGTLGLRVDGKLTGVEIISTDDSLVHISALAVLSNCKLIGKDILIEGKFSGEISAAGKIEFAAGCTVLGTLNKSGEVYFHMLSDVEDLTIKTIKTVNQNWSNAHEDQQNT
jgi:cytoskeletal protein CcmA (bactofilin family)